MQSYFYYNLFFFFNDTATTEIYTLSLHDALPIWFRAKYGANGVNAFLSYITDEKHRLAWPSPLFAPRWYSRKFGVTHTSENPLLHFLLSDDEKSPHPLLDVKLLKDQSSSWRSDALALEFLVDREKHRLKPHPLFDSVWYLERNPDVAEANVNPLEHYLY